MEKPRGRSQEACSAGLRWDICEACGSLADLVVIAVTETRDKGDQEDLMYYLRVVWCSVGLFASIMLRFSWAHLVWKINSFGKVPQIIFSWLSLLFLFVCLFCIPFLEHLLIRFWTIWLLPEILFSPYFHTMSYCLNFWENLSTLPFDSLDFFISSVI